MTPDELNENWTNEMLDLMMEKLAKRLTRRPASEGAKRISNQEFFKKHASRMGIEVKEIKVAR